MPTIVQVVTTAIITLHPIPAAVVIQLITPRQAIRITLP